jgi:hypothetical protein
VPSATPAARSCGGDDTDGFGWIWCSGYTKVGVVETDVDATMTDGRADDGYNNTEGCGGGGNRGAKPSPATATGATDVDGTVAQDSVDGDFNSTDGCHIDNNRGVNTTTTVARVWWWALGGG